jgi:hypothetical protein
LSRRQQHFRDSSVDPQQHRPDAAQTTLDFTLFRLLQGPFARATGSNPIAAMATSIKSVVVVFSVLRRRNMAKFRGGLFPFSAATQALSRLIDNGAMAVALPGSAERQRRRSGGSVQVKSPVGPGRDDSLIRGLRAPGSRESRGRMSPYC